MSRSPSIAEFTPSSVQDNGRRGEPRPGCDCVQCFGYCMVDADKALRDQAERGLGGRQARLTAVNAPVDTVMGDA